jgi:hypothetical protein
MSGYQRVEAKLGGDCPEHILEAMMNWSPETDPQIFSFPKLPRKLPFFDNYFAELFRTLYLLTTKTIEFLQVRYSGRGWVTNMNAVDDSITWSNARHLFDNIIKDNETEYALCNSWTKYGLAFRGYISIKSMNELGRRNLTCTPDWRHCDYLVHWTILPCRAGHKWDTWPGVKYMTLGEKYDFVEEIMQGLGPLDAQEMQKEIGKIRLLMDSTHDLFFHLYVDPYDSSMVNIVGCCPEFVTEDANVHSFYFDITESRQDHLQALEALLLASVCPSCGGEGALIEIFEEEAPKKVLCEHCEGWGVTLKTFPCTWCNSSSYDGCCTYCKGVKFVYPMTQLVAHPQYTNFAKLATLIGMSNSVGFNNTRLFMESEALRKAALDQELCMGIYRAWGSFGELQHADEHGSFKAWTPEIWQTLLRGLAKPLPQRAPSLQAFSFFPTIMLDIKCPYFSDPQNKVLYEQAVERGIFVQGCLLEWPEHKLNLRVAPDNNLSLPPGIKPHYREFGSDVTRLYRVTTSDIYQHDEFLKDGDQKLLLDPCPNINYPFQQFVRMKLNYPTQSFPNHIFALEDYVFLPYHNWIRTQYETYPEAISVNCRDLTFSSSCWPLAAIGLYEFFLKQRFYYKNLTVRRLNSLGIRGYPMAMCHPDGDALEYNSESGFLIKLLEGAPLIRGHDLEWMKSYLNPLLKWRYPPILEADKILGDITMICATVRALLNKYFIPVEIQANILFKVDLLSTSFFQLSQRQWKEDIRKWMSESLEADKVMMESLDTSVARKQAKRYREEQDAREDRRRKRYKPSGNPDDPFS